MVQYMWNFRNGDPEFYEVVKRHSQNILPLIHPKDYTIPEGYADPQCYVISAFSGCQWFQNLTSSEDTTMAAIYSTVCQLIRYSVPTFFVHRELCEALLETDAPEDLTLDEIKFPMPAMLFMLPLEFSRKYFGMEVPYFTTAQLPAKTYVNCPVILNGQPLRRFMIANDKQFTAITMLMWEQELPMHYDVHCPGDVQIKTLINDTDCKFFGPEALVNANPEVDNRTLNRLTNISLNIVLAMTAQADLISRERIIRPAKKKDGKILRRALWKPNFIGEHFRIQYEHTGAQGTHRSPHAHWRRGCWRNQRHGPRNSLVKRIWIHPCFIGLKES